MAKDLLLEIGMEEAPARMMPPLEYLSFSGYIYSYKAAGS